jgi:predicted transcriptional regulator
MAAQRIREMIDQTRSLVSQSRDLPPTRTRRKRLKYHGIAQTRLERYIRSRGLFNSDVARAAHVCRQRLQLWRLGKVCPVLTSIRKLVRGMREMTDDPHVKANDLFPLDDDD